jgi:hypothetical protein
MRKSGCGMGKAFPGCAAGTDGWHRPAGKQYPRGFRCQIP